MPYDMAAMMIIFTVFIVGVFYCLDALYGERRDRSILFWKSLPVSDLTTVLSKVTIPLVILPAGHLRDRRLHAVDHAADDQRRSAAERYGPATTWAHFNVVPAIAGAALQPDRARALACADLWLAAAGFRLGAARDFSLGGIAASRDQNFREDHVQHLVFRQDAARPSDGIRAGRFRFSWRGPSHDRFAGATHSGKIPSTPGLWLGLRIAAAFIAAAVRLRRYRGPL